MKNVFFFFFFKHKKLTFFFFFPQTYLSLLPNQPHTGKNTGIFHKKKKEKAIFFFFLKKKKKKKKWLFPFYEKCLSLYLSRVDWDFSSNMVVVITHQRLNIGV